MSREALGALHTSRLGKRVAPVVVAAERDGQTWLFGPNAQAAVVGPLPTDQAQRMLQSALDEPSGIAARQRLAAMYTAIEGTKPGAGGEHLPGIANGGLFATHELRYGVRQRPDWSSACETAEALLPLRRDALIEALGYTAQQAAAHAVILTVEGVVSRAVAVLLDEDESFDGDSTRFSVSPVAYAVSIAQKHELPWVMILRGSQLRLYPARAELGVGRKGLAETYFEVDLALVTEETAGYLSLVFSATALADGGTTAEILASSAQYAVELGERLRFQVYDQIVPKLSLAIAAKLPALGHELDRVGLDLAYRLTLRVFFRLLFQAYAEDRKLLPYGENPRYDRNALNTLAHDLVENPDEVFDPESTTLWDDLTQVWRVIDKGDKAWSVPPYNGGLFGSDPELEPEGALLDRIGVTNDVMGPVLRAMLVDTDPDEITGAIDFRSLSVREFGTIYEGLLESNLALWIVSSRIAGTRLRWSRGRHRHGAADDSRTTPTLADRTHPGFSDRRRWRIHTAIRSGCNGFSGSVCCTNGGPKHHAAESPRAHQDTAGSRVATVSITDRRLEIPAKQRVRDRCAITRRNVISELSGRRAAAVALGVQSSTAP